MNKLFTLIILFVTLNSFSQSINYLDDLNGYKDLKFGKTKEELRSKIFDCTTKGTCLVIGEKYRKIRDVKIDNVYITFNSQKLLSIILTLKGRENVSELLQIYKETFGKATGRTKGKLEVFWIAKNVVLNYEIMVDKKTNETSAVVIISEKDVLSDYSKKEIKKNLEDF